MLCISNGSEISKKGFLIDSESRILGRGSYGTVFKAFYKGKEAAVKVVKIDKISKLENVLNEANALGWQHRNIVQIFKIEITPGYGIVIMERFPGQCLQAILDSIELSLWHIANISLDIVSALMYCHKWNVLHLDVKPQNILVSFNYEKITQNKECPSRSYKCICKLCDFGSSVRIDKENSDKAKKAINVGTIRYMAPELLTGEKLNESTDIYSLGITMWQIQNRQLPYYWIQCNETVAYQVVKNNLRPDSHTCPLDMISLKQSANRHNCSCEHYSTDISSRSLDDIKILLNQHDTMMASDNGRRTFCKRKYEENFKEEIPLKRFCPFPSSKIPFQQRNIGFKNRKKNTCDSIVDIPLEVKRKHFLSAYQALFTSCWDRDCKRRPSDMEIYEKLKNLCSLCDIDS